jgi:predicted DNA-binding transcriptional regulator AlpA
MDNKDIIMYDATDLKSIFKLSRSQAYALINTSGFPSMRIGKKILVEQKALEAWVDKQRGKTVYVK